MNAPSSQLKKKNLTENKSNDLVIKKNFIKIGAQINSSKRISLNTTVKNVRNRNKPVTTLQTENNSLITEVSLLNITTEGEDFKRSRKNEKGEIDLEDVRLQMIGFNTPISTSLKKAALNIKSKQLQVADKLNISAIEVNKERVNFNLNLKSKQHSITKKNSLVTLKSKVNEGFKPSDVSSASETENLKPQELAKKSLKKNFSELNLKNGISSQTMKRAGTDKQEENSCLSKLDFIKVLDTTKNETPLIKDGFKKLKLAEKNEKWKRNDNDKSKSTIETIITPEKSRSKSNKKPFSPCSSPSFYNTFGKQQPSLNKKTIGDKQTINVDKPATKYPILGGLNNHERNDKTKKFETISNIKAETRTKSGSKESENQMKISQKKQQITNNFYCQNLSIHQYNTNKQSSTGEYNSNSESKSNSHFKESEEFTFRKTPFQTESELDVNGTSNCNSQQKSLLSTMSSLISEKVCNIRAPKIFKPSSKSKITPLKGNEVVTTNSEAECKSTQEEIKVFKFLFTKDYKIKKNLNQETNIEKEKKVKLSKPKQFFKLDQRYSRKYAGPIVNEKLLFK